MIFKLYRKACDRIVVYATQTTNHHNREVQPTMLTAYEYGMQLMSHNVDPGTIVAFLQLEAGTK